MEEWFNNNEAINRVYMNRMKDKSQMIIVVDASKLLTKCNNLS
jgi:hypothetical protein